jgi:hypothetical protein
MWLQCIGACGGSNVTKSWETGCFTYLTLLSTNHHFSNLEKKELKGKHEGEKKDIGQIKRKTFPPSEKEWSVTSLSTTAKQFLLTSTENQLPLHQTIIYRRIVVFDGNQTAHDSFPASHTE